MDAGAAVLLRLPGGVAVQASALRLLQEVLPGKAEGGGAGEPPVAEGGSGEASLGGSLNHKLSLV